MKLTRSWKMGTATGLNLFKLLCPMLMLVTLLESCLMANLSRTIVKGKAALVAVPMVARYILVEYVKTQKGNAKSTYEAIATKLLTSGLVRLKLWIFEGMTVTANHLSKDKPTKDEMIKWYIKPVKGTAIDSTGKEVDTLLNVP